MSIQPTQKINRLELVKILVVGVLLEVGVAPLLPKTALNVLLAPFQAEGFTPLPWIAFLVALAVAYALGRVVNIVSMQVWRQERTVPLSNVPGVSRDWTISYQGNLFGLPVHRRMFADELQSPDKVDKSVVEEFRDLVDETLDSNPPFANSTLDDRTTEDDDDGKQNGETANEVAEKREDVDDETPGENDDGEDANRDDYDALYAFVKSYNRIHGGGHFSTYLATVFTFTRNLALLALGLSVSYFVVGAVSSLDCCTYSSLYTNFANNGVVHRYLPPSALLVAIPFLQRGTKYNMRDYVEYLICDFVSLRTAEEERAARGRWTDADRDHDR